MDTHNADNQADRLNKLPIRVSVRVCGRSMKLDQFLDWVPGTILSFDQSISSPLPLCIGSQTVGEGQAVKVGPKIGIRLLRIGDSPISDAMMTETR